MAIVETTTVAAAVAAATTLVVVILDLVRFRLLDKHLFNDISLHKLVEPEHISVSNMCVLLCIMFSLANPTYHIFISTIYAFRKCMTKRGFMHTHFIINADIIIHVTFPICCR